MSKKNIKELRAHVRQLRQEMDRLRRDSMNNRELARRQREYIEAKFNWFVDLLASGHTPDLPWLIKNMKDALMRFK